MTGSAFRVRGIQIVVDTTEQAEFDVAGYQIGDAAMERIARRLKAMPFSSQDRVVGDIRVRLLEGYDVIYIVGRELDKLVVTIGGLRPPDPNDPTENILHRLGMVAMFRGATGV